MQSKLQLKNYTHSLPLIIFILLSIGLSLYSDSYQMRPIEVMNPLSQFGPFEDPFLEEVTHIELSNTIGKFTLLKKADAFTKKKRWFIPEDYDHPVLDDKIEKIFATLKDLKVKKLFSADPINKNNFSLNRPILSLKLKTTNSSKSFKLGIINPIDNSAFIQLENPKIIYQVNGLAHEITGLDKSAYIDFHLIPLPIKKISLYKGKNTRRRPIWTCLFENNTWSSQKFNDNNKRIFERFLATQAKAVKQRPENLERFFSRYDKNTNYTLVLENSDGEKKSMTIGGLIYKAIPELKIDKKKNLILKSEINSFDYIMNYDKFMNNLLWHKIK